MRPLKFRASANVEPTQYEAEGHHDLPDLCFLASTFHIDCVMSRKAETKQSVFPNLKLLFLKCCLEGHSCRIWLYDAATLTIPSRFSRVRALLNVRFVLFS